MPIGVTLKRLDRRLTLALGLMALPLFTLIGLQLYEAATRSPRLASDRVWVAHTFDVIAAAKGLRIAASDAERAQRGYLISGRAPFLQTYRTRVASCQSFLEQLRRLTSDNPDQQRRLASLAIALDDWIAEREQALDAYAHGGVNGVQQLVGQRAERDTLRTVDGLIAGALAEENELLLRRQAQTAEDERSVTQIALVSSALGIALLGLGAWLTMLAFRRVREEERQHREVERRLHDQVVQAQAGLAQTQKMEALGQLTGGVAHDFNNHLHVIKNAALILDQQLRGSGTDLTQFLDMIMRNTDRAASTTARLLAFARQQALDPKSTDLNKLVSGMAELLRPILGERVQMEAVLGSGLWSVLVDKSQLETAIVNLAINARDAMPNSGKLTIETSNAFLDEGYAGLHPEVKPGQYAMIAVTDTGAGMTPETVAKAFEPFFTTKEAGRGTGLGLSQVFGFIKQSGGHVKIYSELGTGTTVKMYFPRLVGAEMSKPAYESTGELRQGSGESVFLVEDNDDVRAFTAQLLCDLGYRVTVAADGPLALEALEKLSGRVDLLFTDVGLPNGMTGRELADEARRRWPALKVLYTTGYARNSIIHHGRLDTGVELLTKPFTQSSLAAKLRSVLHKPAEFDGAAAINERAKGT